MKNRISAGLLMMLMLTTTRFTKIGDYSITFLPFLFTRALSKKMKVISTDPGAPLPATDGQAEILNSSLTKYPEVTICARYLTHHFSTHSDAEPTQTLISYGNNNFLSGLVARPCDQYYKADICTRLGNHNFHSNDILSSLPRLNQTGSSVVQKSHVTGLYSIF